MFVYLYVSPLSLHIRDVPFARAASASTSTRALASVSAEGGQGRQAARPSGKHVLSRTCRDSAVYALSTVSPALAQPGLGALGLVARPSGKYVFSRTCGDSTPDTVAAALVASPRPELAGLMVRPVGSGGPATAIPIPIGTKLHIDACHGSCGSAHGQATHPSGNGHCGEVVAASQADASIAATPAVPQPLVAGHGQVVPPVGNDGVDAVAAVVSAESCGASSVSDDGDHWPVLPAGGRADVPVGRPVGREAYGDSAIRSSEHLSPDFGDGSEMDESPPAGDVREPGIDGQLGWRSANLWVDPLPISGLAFDSFYDQFACSTRPCEAGEVPLPAGQLVGSKSVSQDACNASRVVLPSPSGIWDAGKVVNVQAETVMRQLATPFTAQQWVSEERKYQIRKRRIAASKPAMWLPQKRLRHKTCAPSDAKGRLAGSRDMENRSRGEVMRERAEQSAMTLYETHRLLIAISLGVRTHDLV